MIRRTRQSRCDPDATTGLLGLRARLLDRRRFLIASAGGTVAMLFGLPARGDAVHDPWSTLDAVLQHLLPSEPGIPGASEIRALDYFRFVVGDAKVDAQEREFILQGTTWLDDLARSRHAGPFGALDEAARETLLRQVATTTAGENWLSTLLTYLFEALLTAPAYGGNPDGIGWRWLEYLPGFPLPGPGTRYPELPL